MTVHEAIKALIEEFSIEDMVYHVRERAAESGDNYVGNSWMHPKVVRFSEVVTTLKKAIGPCCSHPESEHEAREYRGDKSRRCLATGCECKNYKEPL